MKKLIKDMLMKNDTKSPSKLLEDASIPMVAQD